MGLVALPGSPWGLIGASAGASVLAFNDSDDRIAAIYRAPKAGTIDRIFYAPNSKSGTVGVLRLGVQGVSGRVPDGAWLAGGNGYVDLTNPSATPAWQTLGSPVSVNKGDLLAAVALTQSGTWDGANLISMRSGLSTVPAVVFPPVALSYETSWTEVAVTACIALRYDDGEIVVPSVPASAFTNPVSGWVSGANPLFRGNRFSLAIGARFWGFQLSLWSDTGNLSDFDLHLFSGTSFTPLASVAVDVSEWFRQSTGLAIVESDKVGLSAGTVYRVAVEPKSATAFQRFMRIDYLDSDTREQVSRGLIATTAPSGGPWTDDDTQQYSIAPLLDQVDDGAGSGGGLIVHPGMAGGMRG